MQDIIKRFAHILSKLEDDKTGSRRQTNLHKNMLFGRF